MLFLVWLPECRLYGPLHSHPPALGTQVHQQVQLLRRVLPLLSGPVILPRGLSVDQRLTMASSQTRRWMHSCLMHSCQATCDRKCVSLWRERRRSVRWVSPPSEPPTLRCPQLARAAVVTTCSCELEHNALVGQCIGQARVPGPLHSLDDSEGDDYWATGEEQGGNASEVYVDDANAGAWDDWDEAAAISTNCQDYIQAKAFSGPIQGYLFHTGRNGLGYYRPWTWWT